MKAVLRSRGACAGFTSIEVMLGALLMGSLLLVAGLATDRCMAMFRQRRAAQVVSSSANRLLQRVASELTFARRGTLQPVALATQGSSTILYNKCLGVTAGTVQWSSLFTLRWELDTGELDDGLDNNGNGLVDEGLLALIEDEGLASERRVVLGHGLCEFLPGETFNGADEDGDGLIDERGACFSIDGDVLTVRIGQQGSGPDGAPIVRVVQTSVFIRN